MKSFLRIFPHRRCNIIGMIHVPALPGTPAANMSMAEILEKVDHEAEIYRSCGLDGLIIENMHDTPYCLERDLEPHIATCMTMVGQLVRSRMKDTMPVGVQILAAANKSGLAVAKAAELQFIRAEGFVFGHVGDEGWIDACAGPLLKYRHQMGGQGISIFCDIKKKHSAHAVTSDVTIEETAKAAEFFRADGVIVTGTATGDPANPEDISAVMNAVPDIPVLVGSGVTVENLQTYSAANGLIIGSYFKTGGNWENDLDPDRVMSVMEESRKYKL